MKTTKQHFDLFKKECLRWQKIFQLDSFDIFFYWQDNMDCDASCDVNRLHIGCADITLSTKVSISKITNSYIKECAKHEMVHLLIGEYSAIAESRFVTKDEEYKLCEKLVNKLSKLIPN